jgi:hypothetical protein
MLIDDFFGEAHAIMKDSHLKEIARIRNENSVEIAKLKKIVSSQSGNGSSRQATKENHGAFKKANNAMGGTSFDDNAVEQDRRKL